MSKDLRVLMLPHPVNFKAEESGIRRVVEAYARYLPDYGIKLVDPNSNSFDIKAVHAGMTAGDCTVAHLHGIYWTEDYHAPGWEYSANRNIVEALRVAKEVTVPSSWVAETLQRDMRFNPHVVPHGIEWEDWQHNEPNENYVLWNKNRNMDVCDPTPMAKLAISAPNVAFMSTFVPDHLLAVPHNIHVIGLKTHATMKHIVQRAGVYLSTTKETFGIGILEALASGVPVLGFNWGGNKDLVRHGVNGYLAEDQNDLLVGLQYCLDHRKQLSENARELARQWTWSGAVEKVAGIYRIAYDKLSEPGSVSVVIPSYNYGSKLEGAVQSVLAQTVPAKEIIIVDDGSTDDTSTIAEELVRTHSNVQYIRQENAGVAVARNVGIERATSKYISCLDADDRIAPQFLEACVTALNSTPSLGIAYTGLMTITPDGKEHPSEWPMEFNYNHQIRPRGDTNPRGMNQIPTCCVFRKEIWTRSGGYRKRYAPLGAGAEDAEFWVRAGSLGYNAKKVTDAHLFLYSFRTGMVSGATNQDPDLLEPFWLARHPWAFDGKHPFASIASPLNGMSHPVRQYDQPEVSVVIPVGAGHENIVLEALDSLEAQTYRSWEAIVVWDTDKPITKRLTESYPYVHIVNMFHSHGAGAARNTGADHARGNFLVFLDADDELHPHFLSRTMMTWEYNPNSIIYTDYTHEIVTTAKDLENFPADDVIRFNRKTGRALVAGRSADYDCERAQVPMGELMRDVYHWCLVTCLIPRAYHQEIGGFDETMETFEDVLYHWKLARRGHCYTRLQEQLVMYRMDTSTRRRLADLNTTDGLDTARAMLQYANTKLSEVKQMACKTCPGQRARPPINVIQEMENVVQTMAAAGSQGDDNYILVEYIHPGKGDHQVQGAVTRVNYGYRSSGDRFLVHREDIEAHPQWFKEIDPHPQPPRVQRQPLAAPTSLNGDTPKVPIETSSPETEEVSVLGPEVKPEVPPRKLFTNMDIETLPGISPEIAKNLRAAGIDTKEAILAIGKAGLLLYNVPEARIDVILEAIAQHDPKLPEPKVV